MTECGEHTSTILNNLLDKYIANLVNNIDLRFREWNRLLKIAAILMQGLYPVN